MESTFLETKTTQDDDQSSSSRYQKGVKHLCEEGGGVTKVPNKYIFPVSERNNYEDHQVPKNSSVPNNLKLPVIDFHQLLLQQGSNKSHVLNSLSKACEDYGFFQVINHGIPSDIIRDMVDVSRRFFELPLEERSKYMSTDVREPVRYGTSFNQSKDSVFCWRDFLKLMCHSLSDSIPHWPSSPSDFRERVSTYAKQTKFLFLMIMEAILETLGLFRTSENDYGNEILNELEDGSHLMVINCYPSCPEPELTLGMPPHSDYGFLTLLLQDEVEGLQIQHEGEWVTVEPIPNAFVINVGDHLEIFSNGRYKSVLHRAIVNSTKSRTSVASLHSMPMMRMVRPSPKLINEDNPRRYKDTDFATFLDFIATSDLKAKDFLDSRKLTSSYIERIENRD